MFLTPAKGFVHPVHTEELSRKSRRVQRWLLLSSKLNWSARKEQSIGKGDYSIPFYSILLRFVCVCARPNPAWMPEPRAGSGGRAGERTLRGCHELPPTVTNVPLWLQRLETRAQTAGRKEGRKEGALGRQSCSWGGN